MNFLNIFNTAQQMNVSFPKCQRNILDLLPKFVKMLNAYKTLI